MSRASIRILQASQVLKSWEPGSPFVLHFKQLSRVHKQWGGRDRKEIKAICYAWFRLGNATKIFDEAQEGMPWAAYLFHDNDEWVENWKTEKILPEDLEVPTELAERLAIFRAHFEFEGPLFPSAEYLSLEMPAAHMDAALPFPGKLWFRAKKNQIDAFRTKLAEAEIPYEEVQGAFQMESGTSLEQIFGNNLAHYGEVQDYASQQLIRAVDWNGKRIWDACAASGGKALQISQEYSPASLLCSDVRPSILQNLQQRYKKAGLKVPEIKTVDLSQGQFSKSNIQFEVILCDVPCTGSGTFRRTPDAMMAMRDEEVLRYAKLQATIVRNASQALKKDGLLLYATCSVYALENEGHIEEFEKLGLSLMDSAYVDALDKGGDVLYYALFKKS